MGGLGASRHVCRGENFNPQAPNVAPRNLLIITPSTWDENAVGDANGALNGLVGGARHKGFQFFRRATFHPFVHLLHTSLLCDVLFSKEFDQRVRVEQRHVTTTCSARKRTKHPPTNALHQSTTLGQRMYQFSNSYIYIYIYIYILQLYNSLRSNRFGAFLIYLKTDPASHINMSVNNIAVVYLPEFA